jgi:hypothetical protein
MADAAKYSLANILWDLRECEKIRLQTDQEFQFPEFRHNRHIGWMSAEDFAKELERRITLKPGADRHRTFCRARGKPWNADTFDTYCAQAAEREGSQLSEFLKRDAAAGFFQWDISAGAAYWVTGTPSPAAKQEQSEGNGKAGAVLVTGTPSPNGATPPAAKRGRRADTDPEADKKVAAAWATHHYRTHKDLGREFDMTKHQVKTALDRHRHRVK